jgi:Tol biopolymer transport system component
MRLRLAIGLLLACAAPLAAEAQHPTIPWGHQPVMYLDDDSRGALTVRGAFADGRPSVVIARYPHGVPDLPIMAPDGKRVAYLLAEESKPFVLYVADRQQRRDVLRARHLSYPFWSPDGKRLAVLSRGDTTFELVVLAADTARVLSRHTLPMPPDPELSDGMKYRWSPDQHKILLGGSQRSVVVDLQSGRLTHLSEKFIRPDWAPDAKHLYYMSAHGDLFLHDLGANSATRLLERRMHLAAVVGLPEAERPAGPSNRAGIALSPNGRWLAMAWNTESSSLLDIYDTTAPFVSTTPHRRARLNDVLITDVQWAPTGASVVASRVFLKEDVVRLSVFDIATGAWRDIATVAGRSEVLTWAYVLPGVIRPVRWTE